MKTTYPLEGAVPIFVTPFTEDDAIDWESVEREVEQGIDDGITGYIVPAVASEVTKLSDDERSELATAVIRLAAGRIPVIVGVSDPDAPRSRRFAQEALEAGAAGILCSVPMAIIDDNAQVKAYFVEVAKAGMPMLMIQDLHWNGYGMSLDVHLDLWERIEAYRCLKLETVPAGYKLSQLVEATSGALTIGIGWSMPQLIEALDRGATFFTTALLHRPFVETYRLHRADRRQEAVDLFATLLPYLAFKHQHLDVALHLIKRYAVERSVFTTNRVREPVLPFDGMHERHAAEVIAEVLEIEKSL